jgi:hypothetical protein
MRWRVSLVVGLGLLMAREAARADEQADVKAVIAKGIKALGGEAKISKQKALTMKFKGKVYVEGNTYDYTAEMAAQLPAQAKATISMEINGMAVTVVTVINKDKGWFKINNDTMALDKDRLAEEKENIYARTLTSLVMLKDKKFKLSPVGDVKVGDKDAVGIKVSSKGHRDVNLYFDKKTGLLLKSETTAKKMGADMEVSQETLYDSYKEVDGVKHPMKIQIKQDGKKYVDVDETTEIKIEDKLDDSVFDKP